MFFDRRKIIKRSEKELKENNLPVSSVGINVALFLGNKILLCKKTKVCERVDIVKTAFNQSNKEIKEKCFNCSSCAHGKYKQPGDKITINDTVNLKEESTSFLLDCQEVAENCLSRIIQEQAFISYDFIESKQLEFLPAWVIEKDSIHFAFVVPLQIQDFHLTFNEEYFNNHMLGLKTGLIDYCRVEELGLIKITSSRMEGMIKQAFSWKNQNSY